MGEAVKPGRRGPVGTEMKVATRLSSRKSWRISACRPSAAKRLYRIAQGFSPGLRREKFALKVATEARLQALRVLFHQHAQHRLPLSGHLLL